MAHHRSKSANRPEIDAPNIGIAQGVGKQQIINASQFDRSESQKTSKIGTLRPSRLGYWRKLVNLLFWPGFAKEKGRIVKCVATKPNVHQRA
jgi:hypothetical protein